MVTAEPLRNLKGSGSLGLLGRGGLSGRLEHWDAASAGRSKEKSNCLIVS